MLLIFDLDDTLIDTSGSVTPYKLRLALHEMLGREPDESEYKELLDLDEELGSSKKAITTWAQKKGCEPAFAVMTSPLPSHFEVKRTPGCKEILDEIDGKKAIVTIGTPSFQLDKLEKAGIEASIFSNILIREGPPKKFLYEDLGKNYHPSQVWVCGDRILTDLLPALELGFHTVHMQWGRGKKKTEPWIEYSISSLLELRNIVG